MRQKTRYRIASVGMVLFAVCSWTGQGFGKERGNPRSVSKDSVGDRGDALQPGTMRVRLLPTVQDIEQKLDIPARSTLRLNYRVVETESKMTGYFIFSLENGRLTITHGSDQYFGFYTKDTEANKLTEVPFPVDFLINEDIAITHNQLQGLERVSLFLPEGMPTIAVRVMPNHAKNIIFEQESGFLTDARPLAPQVGDQLVLASTFDHSGSNLYQIESQAAVTGGGTEIFTVRNPQGEAFRLTVAAPSDVAANAKIQQRVLDYITALFTGRVQSKEVVSTGRNFVLERVERPSNKAAAGCGKVFKG